jgi:hypothetical protein
MNEAVEVEHVSSKGGAVARVILPVESDPEEMELYAASLVERGVIRVVDQATATRASAFLGDLSSAELAIDRVWDPMKDATNRAHRIVCDQWHAVRDPISVLLKGQRGELARYAQAREAEREREEVRLRVEAEAREREARAATVKELKASGAVEEARVVAEEPILPAAVTVPREKTAGISTREVYGWEPLDIGLAKREFLTWNDAAIDVVVKKAGPEAEKIVGAGAIRVTKRVEVRRAPRRG